MPLRESIVFRPAGGIVFEYECIFHCKHVHMTTNSLSNWPSITPERTGHTMKVLSTRSRRQKSGVVKLITSPAPPDENTIRHLNALASRRPFSTPHKVKKHDTL